MTGGAKGVWTAVSAAPILVALFAYITAQPTAPASFPDMGAALIFLAGVVLSFVMTVANLLLAASSANRPLALRNTALSSAPLLIYLVLLSLPKPRNRRDEWVAMSEMINPVLLQYVEQHRDKVSFPGTDEEAQIEGFEAFAKERLPQTKWKNGYPVDPWGAPAIYVFNRDSNAFISVFGGEFFAQRPYNMADPHTAVGIATRNVKIDRDARVLTYFGVKGPLRDFGQRVMHPSAATNRASTP